MLVLCVLCTVEIYVEGKPTTISIGELDEGKEHKKFKADEDLGLLVDRGTLKDWGMNWYSGNDTVDFTNLGEIRLKTAMDLACFGKNFNRVNVECPCFGMDFLALELDSHNLGVDFMEFQ